MTRLLAGQVGFMVNGSGAILIYREDSFTGAIPQHRSGEAKFRET